MLPNRRRIHLRERADAAAFRALRCALRLTAGHSRHCSAAPLPRNTRERPRPVHTPAWCRGCGTNPARDAGGNPKKRSIALGPALALPGAFRCRRRHPRYARRLSGKPGGWREVVRNRQQLDFGGDQISPAKRSIAARQPYTTSVLRRPARVVAFLQRHSFVRQPRANPIVRSGADRVRCGRFLRREAVGEFPGSDEFLFINDKNSILRWAISV